MSFNWRKEPNFVEEAKNLLEWHSLYENEVIFYFGIRLGQHKEWENLTIVFRPPTDFPDALLLDFKKGIALNVEFEVDSRYFKPHIKKYGEKAIEECDLIVCAKHSWKNCPIDVFNVVNDTYHKGSKNKQSLL